MGYRWGVFALCSLLLAGGCGCSLSKLTTAKLTAALTSDNSTVFTGEEDIELARDALPFTMKLYETLLQRDSTDIRLLLATSKLFSLYAQAFVLFPVDTIPTDNAGTVKAQKLRAKRLFLRARGYALRAFALAHPGISPAGTIAIDSVLEHTVPADTAVLYWCASAWLGAIAADRSDLGLAMSVKRPVAMLRKVCSFDSGYQLGAAHELLGVCAAATPAAIGGGAEAARFHFEQALVRSGERKVSPFVSAAVSWQLKSGNRVEFVTLLRRALAVDLNAEPSLRLQNMISRQRAQWYLDNTGRFFASATDSAAVPAAVQDSVR
jgi:predicted anti-sigma-YlaC factor YlaD